MALAFAITTFFVFAFLWQTQGEDASDAYRENLIFFSALIGIAGSIAVGLTVDNTQSVEIMDYKVPEVSSYDRHSTKGCSKNSCCGFSCPFHESYNCNQH